MTVFAPLMSMVSDISAVRDFGRVMRTGDGLIFVAGLSGKARIGDGVEIGCANGRTLRGEVVGLTDALVSVLPQDHPGGVSIGNRVILCGARGFCPDESWIGRVIDADGQALDGRPIAKGATAVDRQPPAPPAVLRRGLGARLETGLCLFNTMLPFVRGQRVGLFAGSGVGKSTLLANFACKVQADITVIALIGERGREVSEFVRETLGPDGMARAIVVAATSDQSPLVKRQAAWSAMAVAEYFRDQGKQVLFLFDSLTRFADAHREIALSAGEAPSMRGYPPSTSQQIMSLCERAGPGLVGAGDITAIFSVLVAGSDMDEPVADIARGVLDGHIVLDRTIAERGRFPAVDVLRSVSRSLPGAVSVSQNDLIAEARKSLGAYEASELMIKAGLYSRGSDAQLDHAVDIWPDLDGFFALSESADSTASFARLQACLSKGLEPPKIEPPDLK